MGFFNWLKGSNQKESKETMSKFERYIGAAKQGDAQAMYEIGICYYNGDGVARDTEKAVSFLLKAGKRGIKDVYYWLGMIYERGEGIEKDLQQSFEYYKRGAELGDYAAEAELGKDYLYGIGTTKNLELAYKWLTKTPDDIFFSGYYLGQCLLEKGDKAGAIKVLERAVSKCCANQPQSEELLKQLYESSPDAESKRKRNDLIAKQKRSSDLLDQLIATFEDE